MGKGKNTQGAKVNGSSQIKQSVKQANKIGRMELIKIFGIDVLACTLVCSVVAFVTSEFSSLFLDDIQRIMRDILISKDLWVIVKISALAMMYMVYMRAGAWIKMSSINYPSRHAKVGRAFSIAYHITIASYSIMMLMYIGLMILNLWTERVGMEYRLSWNWIAISMTLLMASWVYMMAKVWYASIYRNNATLSKNDYGFYISSLIGSNDKFMWLMVLIGTGLLMLVCGWGLVGSQNRFMEYLILKGA